MTKYSDKPYMLGFAVALTLLVIAGVMLLEPSFTEAQGEPPVIDPGPGTEYIQAELLGLMYRHAAEEEGLPAWVEVAIGIHLDVTVAKSLSDQITEAGGSHVRENIWRVPTKALVGIMQRPDVRSMRYAPGAVGQAVIPDVVSRVSGGLDQVILGYDGGVPANIAANLVLIARDGKVGVVIDAKTATAKTSATAWLSARNIYMPAQRGDAGLTIAAMMPVGQLKPFLTANPDVAVVGMSYQGQGLGFDRVRWPQSARDFEDDLVTYFTTGMVPGEGASGGSAEASAGPHPWDTGLAYRLSEHGVKAWHDKNSGYTGAGVKVGIIDWGFHDLDKIPGLTDMTKSASGNAYCQAVSRGTWPAGQFIDAFSWDCEPNILLGPEVKHGVSIAELVKDMAPDAELFYAQANSPRQVYHAAKWLDETKDVDVIVHAAGWPFDGPGDGWSPFGMSYYSENPSTWFTNEHSRYRYYPSPLTTVDEFVDSDGPVWINAAGNMETITLWADDPVTLGTGTYSKFIKMNNDVVGTDRASNLRKVCQHIPIENRSVYVFNLRWADDWNDPQVDLDFMVFPQSVDPLPLGHGVFINSSQSGGGAVEQHDRKFPVRRGTRLNWGESQQMCLAIWANSIRLPEWIQFQIITPDTGTPAYWNSFLGDEEGRSIVNPSDSINQGLLAMGARNIRASSPQLMDYSSRGPVYAYRANQRTTDPDRVKPDVTAASGAATYSKYLEKCDGTGTAAACGDDLFFGGTSAATGHTGGLAALVVQLFKEIGGTYTPEDVADYLRASGEHIDPALTSDNNKWGKGFIQLPCRPEVVEFPYTGTGDAWGSTDCLSTRQAGQYADYYTFRLDTRADVEITLEATSRALDPYLYLLEGAYTGKTDYLAFNDNRAPTSGKDSRIEQTLEPGVYTVVATLTGGGAGTYQLRIREKPDEVTPEVSLNPSTITLPDDGRWHAFAITTNVPVTVVANPTGQPLVAEITNQKINANWCAADQNDDVSFTGNGVLYLAGCLAGSGLLEIRRTSDWSLIQTYTVTVETPVSAPTWDAELRPSPVTKAFTSDGVQHRFTVKAGGPVDVVVNPRGAGLLEVNTDPSNSLCSDDRGYTIGKHHVTRVQEQKVYLGGCQAGNGIIELRREVDDSLVRTYTVTVGDPPQTWDATLTPDPSTRAFVADGSGYWFTLESGGDVDVVVNPSGTARLEVSDELGSNSCVPTVGDRETVRNGGTVYIFGCVAGTGTIELWRKANNSLVRRYTFDIKANVCNPLQNFAVEPRSGTGMYVSWSDPVSGGLASTGRQVYITKWVNDAWVFERVINEPASRNYSWHLGLDNNTFYAYRVKNICGATSSSWSSWGIDAWIEGAGGAEGLPTPMPTPTPEGASGSSQEEDEEDLEQPPTPRG